MVSTKRFAQLGLGAAGLVLVASVIVLMIGAADQPAARGHGTPINARPIATVTADGIRPTPRPR